MPIAVITKACVRRYSDTGQTTAYVEWCDQRGRAGRTEGQVINTNAGPVYGAHMRALFARAQREGVAITHERW